MASRTTATVIASGFALTRRAFSESVPIEADTLHTHSGRVRYGQPQLDQSSTGELSQPRLADLRVILSADCGRVGLSISGAAPGKPESRDGCGFISKTWRYEGTRPHTSARRPRRGSDGRQGLDVEGSGRHDDRPSSDNRRDCRFQPDGAPVLAGIPARTVHLFLISRK